LWIAAPLEARPAGYVKPNCPPVQWNNRRYDYNSADDVKHFRNIEYNHKFAPDSPTQGPEAASTPDVVFVLGYVPNHHRGLNHLARLSLQMKMPMPPWAKMSVECWLIRATVFKPDDGVVWQIYGTYLARLGFVDEAIEKLRRASELLPNAPVISYNLGLMLFEKGDFGGAMEQAKLAYAGGVELPGLRDKLKRAGHWKGE
jgi:tetratricopeptide (TPR) repeat protein